MTLTLFGRRIDLASPIHIRRITTCGACADRGWWYTIGTTTQIRPPANCSGVALCTCGAAEHRVRISRRTNRRLARHDRYHSRMGLRRRLVLAITRGRRGNGEPPF